MKLYNIKTGIWNLPIPQYKTTYQTPSLLYCGNYKAQKDDTSGTFTGTNGALIENPADVIRHLMVKRGNGLVAADDFNITTDGDLTLGSWIQARTDLNALVTGDYKLCVSMTEETTVDEARVEMQRHCPGLLVYRSPIDGKWQAVCYQSSPSAEKIYSPAFNWNAHIDQKSPFELSQTPVDEIYTRVYVHYRYFAPQDKCLRTAFISPDGSDDGEGGTDGTRVTNAGTRETTYGMKNTFESDFPWIADKDSAVALRNYIFDRAAPVLRPSFSTFHNAVDLRVGHIITFDADVDTHMVYPKYGGTVTWASKQFQVTQNPSTFKKGQGLVYHIQVVEV